jgi:hypothetical protein
MVLVNNPALLYFGNGFSKIYFFQCDMNAGVFEALTGKIRRE